MNLPAIDWPTIRSAAWRLVRTAVATAFAETIVFACGGPVNALIDGLTCYDSIKAKWSDPALAAQSIGIAFVAGFLVALSKVIREKYGDPDRSKGIINKLFV